MPAAPLAYEPGAPFTGPVDTDLAEERWCAYAWPVAAGNSGLRTFYVDQDGDVWWTANTDRRYSGTGADKGPAWDAARPAEVLGTGWASPPKNAGEVGYRGRDGNVWKRTN